MKLENYSYLVDVANDGLRLDERKPMERREVKIKTGVLNHADGSAAVEIGGTKVLAGVKVLEGVPYPDRPDEGSLIVNFEASELASDYPQDRIIYSVELGRVTDRGIRESRLIDMKKMSIESGKRASFVYIDIYAINNDGNLLDACNFAALAAVLNAKYKVVGSEEVKRLPLDLDKLSISSTFVKIGKSIFLDPERLEEHAADAVLTIAVSDTVNSMQKGGYGYFSPEEVDFCIGSAFDLRDEVKRLLMDLNKG